MSRNSYLTTDKWRSKSSNSKDQVLQMDTAESISSYRHAENIHEKQFSVRKPSIGNPWGKRRMQLVEHRPPRRQKYKLPWRHLKEQPPVRRKEDRPLRKNSGEKHTRKNKDVQRKRIKKKKFDSRRKITAKPPRLQQTQFDA